jgi:predicted nucleotidyltransferase
MRDAIKAKLAAHRADLDRLGVKSLSVFGSAARGDENESSDLDVLVEFSGPATLDRFMDLKDLLERISGRRVDLVTQRALKPLVRSHIQQELVRVA